MGGDGLKRQRVAHARIDACYLWILNKSAENQVGSGMPILFEAARWCHEKSPASPTQPGRDL
jgi:hypothetical protein